MLYVYAITEPGVTVSVPGIADAPVHTLRVGDLAVLVSRHEDLSPGLDEDGLWAHETVVEAAAERAAAVLPMRLGSAVPDEGAVRSFVRERAVSLRATLDHIRGTVELAIRAAVDPGIEPAPEPEAEAAAAGPGTAYLLSRLERRRASEEIMRAVHPPLAELARDHVRLGTPLRGEGAVRLAYLVERNDVDAFRRRVVELEDRLPHVLLSCTGPWPPYSFTGGEEE